MTGRWRRLGGALLLPLLVGGGCVTVEGPPDVHRNTAAMAPPRSSWKALRDRHVVKQQLDYSCGAAALATLLRNYFGEETSERDILDMLMTQLTQEEQQRKARRGFSLLDL